MKTINSNNNVEKTPGNFILLKSLISQMSLKYILTDLSLSSSL